MHSWYWGAGDSPDNKEGQPVSSARGEICELGDMPQGTIFIDLTRVLDLLLAGLRKQIRSLDRFWEWISWDKISGIALMHPGQ